MFESPRRRRRRRIILPLVATIVVAVGVLVATAGDDARSTISYLEQVQNSSLEVSRAGANLSGLVGDLSRVDRAEFDSVVDGVRSALESAQEAADTEAPSEDLVGAVALFRLAVESWQEGIDGFSDAILRAADDPTDDDVIDDLASAVVLVRAGDRIYEALIEEFEREDVPAPVAEMPEVRLLPVDTPITVLAPAWVSAVQSEASGLPMRASVRIEQVSTSPTWVTSADGGLVVPATDEIISILVVVGNSGNTATEEGTLTLTFMAEGAEPVEMEEEVPVIEANASTTVIYPDLEVTPGIFYQVELDLDPGGPDTFTDDNQHSTGFLVNEATPPTTTTTTEG